MTVTAHLNGHDPHGAADDTVVIARAVGVLVPSELDITTRYVSELAPDETGGFGEFTEIVEREYARQRDVEVRASETYAVPEKPRRRLWRRLASWAARALQTTREAITWLTQTPAFVESLKADKVRRAYRARHGRKVSWYGAQRSTSQFISAARRTRRDTPTDQELALPAHFVSFIALAMDAARGYDEVLHPTGGYQYAHNS